MKLIQLIKSMLLPTGRIVKSKSGKGFNLYGLNPDTFDVDAINKCLTSQGIAMEATYFDAVEKFDPTTGEPDSKPEACYVGPPSDGTSDSELDALIQSYKV